MQRFTNDSRAWSSRGPKVFGVEGPRGGMFGSVVPGFMASVTPRASLGMTSYKRALTIGRRQDFHGMPHYLTGRPYLHSADRIKREAKAEMELKPLIVAVYRKVTNGRNHFSNDRHAFRRGTETEIGMLTQRRKDREGRTERAEWTPNSSPFPGPGGRASRLRAPFQEITSVKIKSVTAEILKFIDIDKTG